jgi:hypothetical protein
MSEKKEPPTVEPLEPLIHSIRGQRVMLDADLARIYGVSTKVLNQAVKRNHQRFPEDFAFQLMAAEDNRSQIVTGSQKHRDPRFRPWVFTEHGALMAANVLRSRRAVQMSVYVIRAFVRLREQIGANQAILKRLAEIDKTLLQHDTALRDIYQKLRPLLQPPPAPPRRRIGFRKDE